MENLVEEILKLKRENNAIILAHNYQLPEVQDIADYVGDSLELSVKAMESSARYIVFAGVDFMAEQASVLARDKVVLHPDTSAGCPLASSITTEDIHYARKKYPNAPIVMYVNSPAIVKAYSDYIVTSSSAVKLVSQLDSDTIVFGPDTNLAKYVEKMTGKKVIPIPGNAYCPVHLAIKAEHIVALKNKYRDAKVTVHPECSPEVWDLADHVGSTSQIIKYVSNSSGGVYIIGTEIGVLHKVMKENPGKQAIPAYDNAICINMKKITLEKIRYSLLNKVYRVEVPNDIAERMLKVLERSFTLLGIDVPWKRSF